MGNPNAKNEKNVAGAWYCTSDADENGQGCIACGVCYGGAADFFASDDDGNAYVQKQPENDAEKAECQEQADACPVEAIGSDA